MSKNYSLYILAGALFILGLSLGFFIAKQMIAPMNITSFTGNPGESNEQGSSANEQSSPPDKLFSSQSASIRGQITKVASNMLTVKNLNNSVTGDIIASTKLAVIKNGKTSPVSDFSTLELNKEVLINLEMTGGNYQAVLIQYPQPLPSVPPVAKTNTQPSSQPKNP